MLLENKLQFPRILICDDDQGLHLALKSALKKTYDASSAYSGEEALTIIKNKKIDIVLLDISMKTPDEGIETIPLIKALDPDVIIVMMSGKNDFLTVKEAMKKGADDFIQKGFEKEELLITLKQNLDKKLLLKKASQNQFELKTQAKKNNLFIGESQIIQKLRKTIDKIRDNSSHVIITGETGTGKEVVARQLRSTDPRTGDLNPFIAVDSSTIQNTMAESILFGHEKGAFTGATEIKKGLFEHADGGILYFDEISNMPLEIQNKLLRIIQEKEVLRLGSSKAIPINFRVVCATNKNLQKMCEEGLFKEDLYQRLNVIPIHLHPLKERKEDIPLLLEYFLQKEGRNELQFTEETVQLMLQYNWPGNIRELYNTVLYVCAMTENQNISPSDLPVHLLNRLDFAQSESILKAQHPTEALGLELYHEAMKSFETEYLKITYKKFNGNISQMSNSIKMDRSHLFQKLKNYGIHSPK